MRILHIFDHSLPLQSGYVTRSVGILRAQQARGWHTAHLTSPRHLVAAGASAETETIDGLTVHRSRANPPAIPVLRELAEMNATRRALAALVESEKPDILHAHSPVLNVLPALSVGRRYGLPVVYEARALWEDAAVDLGNTREGSPRYRATRMLDTYAMRRADRVVAICEPLRAEIIARGLSPDRVSVVPNAVDTSFLGAPAQPDEALRHSLGLAGKLVLGFIGSFYSYEGLDLLIEAAVLLRQRGTDWAILLVGGGPEGERLRAMVAERDLGDFVKFVDRVPLAEVPRYYGIIDVMVYPRRRMRLTDLVTPLKPLEAMAQRKALIASDVGGHRELVKPGVTGLLFAPDDAAALVSAVERVRDPAERARLAQQGRQFIEMERTWSAVVERYADVYEALLKTPKLAAPAPAAQSAQ